MFKTDCQRWALLVIVRFGVFGGLIRFRGMLAAT
ncbi:DUF3265 domain-containing protein [Vibrio alginolyticus]|nr:DUF3265 domain-containing protein [Vibrio alginolyticus]